MSKKSKSSRTVESSFGIEEPSFPTLGMEDTCKQCGAIYADHLGGSCPVVIVDKKGKGEEELYSKDAEDEWVEDEPEDLGIDESEFKGSIAVKEDSSGLYPFIAVDFKRHRVEYLRQFRDDIRPLAPPGKVERKYPLLASIFTWYVLEVIKNVYLPKAPDSRKMMKSFERFEEQLNETHSELTAELANVFFDYIALATWGEARHAWTYCSLVSPGISWEPLRVSAAREAIDYDPYKFLPILEKLFKVGEWRGNASFGGHKWGQAAEYGQKKGKIEDDIFIDSCVDLVHNRGPLFTKPYIIVPVLAEEWQNVFNYKTRSATGLIGPSPTETYPSLTLTQTVLDRSIAMGIIPEGWKAATSPNELIAAVSYEPLKWGTKELVPLLLATPRIYRCKLCVGISKLCPCLKCPTCKVSGCLKHRKCDCCGATEFKEEEFCCDPSKQFNCQTCGLNIEKCKCTYSLGANYGAEKKKKKVSKAARNKLRG